MISYVRKQRAFFLDIVTKACFSMHMYTDGPSRIDTDSSNVARKEGTALAVTCSSDCKPGCAFEWTAPGGGTLESGDTLMIDSLNRVDHHGTITCEAKNKYGSLTQTINVTVYCKDMLFDICILYTARCMCMPCCKFT